MFSELPKLFDRNFVIAYFLPAAIFTVLSGWLLNLVGYWYKVTNLLTGNNVFDSTVAVFTAWIIGILLLVFNREIYRFLEGYGKYNPLRLYERRAKQKFIKKLDRLKWLDKEYSNLTDEFRQERSTLMKELAESYPDRESLVLPTAFGNALRAFEVYPRVMYGFESIDGWPRILAMIPKDYRELIDDAKSQVDWWVNLGVMSFIFLIEFWYVIFYKWGLAPGWFFTILNIFIPLTCFFFLNWVFLWRATSSAIGWGDYVKSAFDLYRFTLLESLGIDIPKNRKEERALWTRVSQAILFHLPNSLPAIKKDVKKKKVVDKEKKK